MMKVSMLVMSVVADEWEDFTARFGKNYAGDELKTRRAIFQQNLEFINTENAKGHSYTLGIGPFADITAEEFKMNHFGYVNSESEVPDLGVHQWHGEELLASLDWTEQGVVTPVKDQGQCGSCWSFSTTGALESGYKIASGNLVSLSEQQYVDCDGFPNMGCNGGSMQFALRYAKDHDICSESSYPYEAKGGKCRTSGCEVALKSGTVTGVVHMGSILGSATDEDMMSALAKQPLSIAIEADQDIFQHYKSGVITGNCGTSTDHGVLLVGYGTDGSDAYWKVKNSWGPSWGDNGYVRMVRGKNQCGINSGVNYPTFASSLSV